VIFAIASPGQIARILSGGIAAKDLLPMLTVVGLALTYSIGWIFNFASERLFRLFGRDDRQRAFCDLSEPYANIRVQVLQCGSDALIHELRMDRHIIRLARSSFLNFGLLGISLLLNWRRFESGPLLALVAMSGVLSVAAFLQWLTRYRSYYKTVAEAFQVIASETTKTT